LEPKRALGAGRSTRPATSAGAYDRLSAAELVEIISSLEPDALIALRRYEESHLERTAVLQALDIRLAQQQGSQTWG
jgi:hypothetical protein